MSLKEPVIKFKYRIVVNDDTDYPYLLKRKGLIFWHTIGKCRSLHEAKEDISKLAKLETMRPGSVVLEYTEQDYMVDKLKA